MAQLNLHSQEEDLLVYLGTYFPRSFAEAYVIASILMENALLRKVWAGKQNIRICDLGSGTGGNLFGFLQGLRKYLSCDYGRVEVLSLDGNSGALDLQQRLIQGYAGEMRWKPQQVEITCLENFQDGVIHAAEEFGGEFDAILCFKFLNEMYRSETDEARGGYYASLMELAERLLNRNGILVLSEVTDKLPTKDFIPKVIAPEQAAYIRQSTDALRCILPVSCGKWGGSCHAPNECFSQQTVYIRHAKAQNDCSKFSYRVMAREQLAKGVLSSLSAADSYIVFPGTNDSAMAMICRDGQCEWVDRAEAERMLLCHETSCGYCLKERVDEA